MPGPEISYNKAVWLRAEIEMSRVSKQIKVRKKAFIKSKHELTKITVYTYYPGSAHKKPEQIPFGQIK